MLQRLGLCGFWLYVLLLTAPSARAEGPPPRREGFFAELGLGFSSYMDDAYLRRLEDFKFQEDIELVLPLMNAQSVGYVLHRNFALLVRHELLERRSFTRYLDGVHEDEYGWTTRALALGARGRLPLVREWIALRAQLNVGLGLARTSYRNAGEPRYAEREVGFTLGGLLGADFNFFKYGGAFVETGYVFAPVLENRFGETHDDGGIVLFVGLRLRTLEGA